MIETVLDDKNIKEAFNNIQEKSQSPGKDGMNMCEVYDYYLLNKESIHKSIYNHNYKCKITTLHEMLDYKGKQRIISKMCAIDKLISRALTQVLNKEIDSLFTNQSYAYRHNFGVNKAVNQIFEYVKENRYVCSIDIKNYFDEIKHDILLKELNKIIKDKYVINLINSFVKCEIEYDYITSYKSKGIIQGNSLSPILSNIYLNSLDHHLEDKNINYVRFADNLYLFFNDRNQAYNYINHVKQLLEDRYHLELNKKKSGVYESVDCKYLGYRIIKTDNDYQMVKIKREKPKYYNSWYSSPLRYSNNQYHILDDGILRKKDFHILFENESQSVQIPIEIVDHINIYSDIIFSSSFFENMNNKKLCVNIFNRQGIYIGQFMPNSMKKGVTTILNQALKYNDSNARLIIVKKMVNACIHNERANIKYYSKHINNEILKESIDKLTGALKELNECNKYEDILLIEARCKQIYYHTFDIFVNNDDFIFDKRSKQPPLNNINALISFGNTVLYNIIANEINKTSLDIRIGYLHASNKRKQSLNLDIADIFKPIVIDRVIFTMINKKIINKEHFEEKNNGIYLTQEGKNIFIQQINNKLYSHIHYEHEKITYYSLIRNNIYAVLQHINDDKKLKFYKYQ